MRPFCQITLTCSRSRTHRDFGAHADLGKLIRERRRKLGANQVICALRLGVCHKTGRQTE